MIKADKISDYARVGDIEWELNGMGFFVTMPDHMPCDHAYGFKIECQETL